MSPENNEPSIEDLYEWERRKEMEHRPGILIDKPLDKFVLETAYHEASHFVIQVFLSRLNLGFSKNYGVNFNVKRGEVFSASVVGFYPYNLQLNEIINQTKAKQREEAFYEGNKRRIIAELFSVMAGSSSYNHFIDAEETRFYSALDAGHMAQMPATPSANYYNLEECVNNGTEIGDIKKAKVALARVGVVENSAVIDILASIVTDIQQLMKIKSVDNAIRFVSKRIRKSNGSGIGEVEADVIVSKVLNLTGNVDMEGLIEKYVSEL